MRKPLDVRNEIDELKIPLKEKLLTFLIALIIGLLVVSGPITILVNLLVYIQYGVLLLIGIGVFALFGLSLIDYLYLKGITKGKVKSIMSLVLIDDIMFLVVVISLVVIIGIKGGIF